MGQSSWPDPAASHVVNDVQFEQLFSPLLADGFAGVPTDPAPVYGDSTGKHVSVRANQVARIAGHGWTSGGTDYQLTIVDNTSGMPRIDRVVLRLDRSTWAVTTVVKQGTAATNPIVPALRRDSAASGSGTGMWEIPLAQVNVANGFTTINPSDVTVDAWFLSPAAITCTSTTLPPPTQGLRVWETDTGRQFIGNGTGFAGTIEDSGGVGITPSNGWGVTGGVRRINGCAFMSLIALRGGGTVPATGYSQIAQVPAGFIPSGQVDLLFYMPSAHLGHGYVTSGGVVAIDDFWVNINTGDTIVAHAAAWPVGG